MIPMARPVADEDDIEAVVRVLRSGQWAHGPEVTSFEADFAAYVGVSSAVAVANGTLALHAALVGAGVRPGDLVLTTPLTFIATTNSIIHAGAQPVFADVDPATFGLDPDAVARVVATKPIAAILAVHLYGHPCDLTSLSEVARKAGIPLIEDCAQAHGAQWLGRRVGSFGVTAAFSFYATKNLATGEGGMVVTPDPAIAERMRRFINHGRQGQYEHVEVGTNYRMSSLHAALGRTQLRKLEARNEIRRSIAARYGREISNPRFRHPTTHRDAQHVFHQYTVRVDDRDALKAHLERGGVSSTVVYPRLSYQQRAYEGHLMACESCPQAEQAVRDVLCLPIHAMLDGREVERVIEACNAF